ncbi:MAG: hypothetical protein ACXVAE_04770 [Candidatus Limnocylindrales bacterium]
MTDQRDVLIAVVGGVAVGLLALAFPSWVALLGLIPAAVASFDFARRRQIQPIGLLLLAAALTAGLPTGLAFVNAARTPDTTFDPAMAAVFALACGALVLGVMLMLIPRDEPPALPLEPLAPPVSVAATESVAGTAPTEPEPAAPTDLASTTDPTGMTDPAGTAAASAATGPEAPA